MIAIDGMEMPTECLECPFLDVLDMRCMLTGNNELYDRERGKDCPIYEVENGRVKK